MKYSMFKNALIVLASACTVCVTSSQANAASFELTNIIGNPEPNENDAFGAAVSIENNRILVGEGRFREPGSRAYLFDTNGELLQVLDAPSDSETFGDFGSALDLDGNLALIGERFGNRAHLFNVSTGELIRTFINTAPFVGPGNQIDDFFNFSIESLYGNFGESVQLLDNQVLIGAPNSEAAFLFDAVSGDSLTTFETPSIFRLNGFGASVNIFGDRVLIGAPGDDTGADDAGAAFLFDKNTGELLQSFFNPNPMIDSLFGDSVSIMNGLALIGAPSRFFGRPVTNGAAYLFDIATGDLLQTFSNPAASTSSFSGDEFGRSVVLKDGQALIGSHNIDTDNGGAYLFDITTGELIESFQSPISFGVNNRFGAAVDFEGRQIVIGEPLSNEPVTDAGFAYLFQRTSDSPASVPEPSALIGLSLLAGMRFTLKRSLKR